MSDSTLIENNPFFKHDIDKLCLICNCKLNNQEVCHSIFQQLSETLSQMKVCDALESISNFKGITFQTGAEKICDFCYKNTSSTMKFLELCDKSAALLMSYIQYQKINIQTGIEMPKLLYFEEVMIKPEVLNDVEEPAQIVNMQIWPELTTITTGTTCPGKPIEPEFTTNVEVMGIKQEILNDDFDMNHVDLDDRPDLTTTKALSNTDKLGLDNDEIQINDNGVLKVKCKECNTFQRKDYIRAHMRQHTDDTPYSCDICGKQFKNRKSKNAHKTVHEDQRNFQCTVCGKAFKLKANYKSHIMRHTNVRPHECTVCGKRFQDPRSLRQHYSVHSDERPFACEQCGKCFQLRKYLKQHMNSHSEEKRHQCHVCGIGFTQRHSLTFHLSNRCKEAS